MLIPQNVAATKKTLEPIADSYVSSYHPTSNYGGSDWLWVTYWNLTYSSDLEERSYLKFDLSDIPTDAIIDFAKLRLYTARPYEFLEMQTTKIGAYYCPNNSWTELEITWNNAPSATGDAVDITTVASFNEWYEWDVKSVVEKGGTVSIILMIEESEKEKSPNVAFSSRDRSPDTEKTGPELEIEYTPAGIGLCLGTVLVALIPMSVVVGYINKKRKQIGTFTRFY